MRMRLFLVLVASVLLVACTQSEGEVCQSDRDCDDGLVCTPDEDDRGFCQDPADVDKTPPAEDASEPDLRPDPDASMDGAVDAGKDAGDDAGFDGGPSDDDAG